MTATQVLAWREVSLALLQAGIMTVKEIRELMSQRGASPEEIDAIVRAVQMDATRRKALAEADAAGSS